MSITHIGAVPVHVTDLDRAADYYTRVLGLTLLRDTATGGGPGPRMLWIGFPEGRAILILLDARAIGAPERVGEFTGIVLDVDDAPRTAEELTARGAILPRPLQRHDDGWRAVVADPDGNGFLLYQPHDEAERH
ncbi:MAG TPA: VOC family protein [Longimicrobiaceae bacterium]|nr:VOC family protein [Longimicrobiaceae bacterium]